VDTDRIEKGLVMDIDKELDRMIEADLEDWKSHKHQAVFSFEGCDEAAAVGELYVDGKPIRAGVSGGSAWVTLAEAKHVAARIGTSLQIA
jgi:hypothetical protein